MSVYGAEERSPAVQRFKDFCVAYSARDMEGVRSLFIETCVNIGTGHDEVRCGWQEMEEQLERDYAQSKSVGIELVSITGYGVMWACGLMRPVIDGVTPPEWALLRWTIVVQQDQEAVWKIVHTHASAVSVEQEEGQSFPSAGA